MELRCAPSCGKNSCFPLLDDGTPKTEIALVLGIGRATLYRHLSPMAG
ncbi:helix-turn-helix domain-containing protein [Rhodococcus sp. IEGM 1381]|nr:helix-turn-helix domain-containing protein [Rhodococcus sp. IEGM 1381]MDI9894724.1 helix-turn-helix domain-containing protein [Rhodococcus sp. IEGM 1381]